MKEYLTKLQADKNASDAYCAFFTLYRVNQFAYGTGPYLVMHYKERLLGHRQSGPGSRARQRARLRCARRIRRKRMQLHQPFRIFPQGQPELRGLRA